MLCDPHNPSLAEMLDNVLRPFVMICAIVLAAALAVNIAARRRPNLAFCLSIAMVVGWLTFPAIPLYQEGDSIRDLPIGILIFAFGTWLVSPLLILLCIPSWSARGSTRFVIPLALFLIGFVASWLTLDAWTNTC